MEEINLLTLQLAKKYTDEHGGGGGTSDYSQLTNKPEINGVTLSGDKSASDLSLASLDANGKVPAAQLPSYVDDIINGYLYEGHFYEDSAHTTEITGESGKIYVDLETNKTYRWGGSAYVEVSESLALGETASTAYAGNKGKANADAIAAIKDGTSIDSFADVETALAGKQGALTAGQYIQMQGSTISVNRSIAVNTERKYVFRGSAGTRYVDTYLGDVLQSTTTCSYTDGNRGHHVFNDELDVVYDNINYWEITNLKASTTQPQGYVKKVFFQDSNEYTQIFEIELDADKKLIIKSELDAAVNAIKDGQSIDSFADVETALASKADLTDLAPAFSTATAYTVGQYVSYEGNIYKCTSAHSAGAWVAGDFTLVAVGSELESKQDTLTFDNVPTNGSNNPVKSDGIYDALADKQDIFERISYADWQLLSPQQQAAKPYYIYDYPSTQITAANVSYDHTQSGLSATTAQGGIDELASEKQDKTDNSLQTTQKDIVPAINEIKSGLTSIGGRFAVVEGTNAAAIEQFTTLPMPSGFDAYNTVILGYTSQYSNDLWYSSNSGLYVDANGANVFVTVKDAGFASKPFKVVLYKFA